MLVPLKRETSCTVVRRQTGFIATAIMALLLIILTLLVLSDLQLIRALWVATTQEPAVR